MALRDKRACSACRAQGWSYPGQLGPLRRPCSRAALFLRRHARCMHFSGIYPRYSGRNAWRPLQLQRPGSQPRFTPKTKGSVTMSWLPGLVHVQWMSWVITHRGYVAQGP